VKPAEEFFVMTRVVNAAEVAAKQQRSPLSMGVESSRLTPDGARQAVLSRWKLLEDLSRKRFPGDSNLADEALLFVLDHLQGNEWRRVRNWQASGEFSAYLLTLARRLLTDFDRKKRGHPRPPNWLAQKTHPAWREAYRLLAVQKCSRWEALNQLRMEHHNLTFAELIRIVSRVRAHLNQSPAVRRAAPESPAETLAVHEDDVPEALLRSSFRYFAEALSFLLLAEPASLEVCDPAVQRLVAELEPHLDLDREEKQLLRLRYLEGLNMREIVRRTGLCGDPYKRCGSILRAIRRSLEAAGFHSCHFLAE
jgi:DNA-directed RNA polymerase specialized sigma24 family protein